MVLMTGKRFQLDIQRFAEGDPPAPPATPPATPPDDPKVFTQEYVSALRGEAAGYRTELKAERQTVAKLKAHFGLKETDTPDWDALLKSQKETTDKALADALGKGKALILKAEAKSIAADLGIVDADDALKLADLSKVTVDDDGKVDGVKEALEALLTAKPWLKKQGSGGAGGGNNPGDQNKSENPWKKETFNLTKQAEIFKKDPALAERLRSEAKGK
jgi:hypothetical protein